MTAGDDAASERGASKPLTHCSACSTTTTATMTTTAPARERARDTSAGPGHITTADYVTSPRTEAEGEIKVDCRGWLASAPASPTPGSATERSALGRRMAFPADRGQLGDPGRCVGYPFVVPRSGWIGSAVMTTAKTAVSCRVLPRQSRHLFLLAVALVALFVIHPSMGLTDRLDHAAAPASAVAVTPSHSAGDCPQRGEGHDRQSCRPALTAPMTTSVVPQDGLVAAPLAQPVAARALPTVAVAAHLRPRLTALSISRT